MYLPENEIERVAVSMMAEFGDDAERKASDCAESARDRGLCVTTHIWGRVLERIAQLHGSDIGEFRKAA